MCHKAFTKNPDERPIRCFKGMMIPPPNQKKPVYKTPTDKLKEEIRDLWRVVELMNKANYEQAETIEALKRQIKGNRASLRHHIISVHSEEYMSNPKNALGGC